MMVRRQLAVPETKSRTNYRDRNELMISDLNIREALYRSGTQQQTMITRRLAVS
jgi:hypothetical protein